VLARVAGGPDTLCSTKFLAPVCAAVLGMTVTIRFRGNGPKD